MRILGYSCVFLRVSRLYCCLCCVLCLCWCSLSCCSVCVNGGRGKYLLETSVVNMSDDVEIRLYLCRFAPEIALEKCI